jgi:hypothetical protein
VVKNGLIDQAIEDVDADVERRQAAMLGDQRAA